MKLIPADEEKAAEHWFNEAAQVARQAKCLKAHCGSVIVKDGEIIGEGYNGPPLDDESSRTCIQEYTQNIKPYSIKLAVSTPSGGRCSRPGNTIRIS